jgi:recombinational DNA repair ATPase RecF
MELDLAPRLNLLTGDNGLGKSFLLDVAWWAMTRRWPRDGRRAGRPPCV